MKTTAVFMVSLLVVTLGSFAPVRAETEELMTCEEGQQSNRQVSGAIAGLQAELTKVTVPQIYQTVSSRNEVQFYVDCIVNAGSCNRLGKAIQSFLFDSRNGCADCLPCERERVRYVLRTLYCKYDQHVPTINDHLQYNVFATYLGGSIAC